MAQVGKLELDPKTRNEVAEQMNSALFAIDRSHSRALFDELLTDVERLMLSKRLATILMLVDDQSYYRIQQSLGVSVSTSKRLHGLLVRGAFPSVEKLLRDRRKHVELVQSIEKVVRGGLPPRAYVIKKRRNRN